MIGRIAFGLSLAALTATPALAGPPYETDDPAPTETGHWEIYAFGAVDGDDGNIDGAAGIDFNYGAAEGVQLTATLPVGFARQRGQSGWTTGGGDVELGVKYRFLNHDQAGFSVAVFPRAILPTASNGFGSSGTRFLLPVWAQQDIGPWSVFGGGGYEINPGTGNRDFWQAGLAVTRTISDRWSVGGEMTHQGPDTVGARSTTSLGIGSIVKLGGPVSLLLSGGPSFSAGATSYHLYTALGFGF